MTLELEGLTKVYKDKTALDDVSFSFTPGIYGLLGPNGAGKSTMMNLISDNLTPSKGRVLLDGRGIDELGSCLLYTSPSPRDPKTSRMPSSA